MIDYKVLLEKYMEHVGVCEGSDFTQPHHRTMSNREDVVFTDEEWAFLTGETA